MSLLKSLQLDLPPKRFALLSAGAFRPTSIWIRMLRLVFHASLFLIAQSLIPPASAAEEATSSFSQSVVPFLRSYCVDCHGGDVPEGGVGLDNYQQSSRIQTDIEIWEKVLRMVTDRTMPPADMPQPTEAELKAAIAGIERELATYDCSAEPHPGRVTIRRLNRAEYNNTIRDLVGIDFHPADDFPSDDVGAGFDNIGDVLSMPPLLLEKYLAAAEEIAEKSFAEGKSPLGPITADTPEEGMAAFTEKLRMFATRAFRRPVTEEELQRLRSIAMLAFEEGNTDSDCFTAPMQAVLVSPHFLFRVELDPAADDADGIRELNDYELASRLSYFLWSSMPDQELFDLAAEGKLHDPQVLHAQVDRMLDDPKSRALVDNFAGQWLQLRDLSHLNPDPVLFPNFDDELRVALRRETELLFESIIQEDRSVIDLLTAEETFMNERLARHYGISGVTGEQFQRVDLPEHRRGILTQASILLLTSNPTRTSPVKRGKWILDNLLGEPPPPPPANVPELEETSQALGSLRERLEEHRRNPNCAVCHHKMDALGFGLENFDAVGAWRDADGHHEINPAGTLPGGASFNGPTELVQILVDQYRDEFVRCLTKKMLTYALGRELTSADRCAVDRIEKQLAAESFRFRSLVNGIVTSDPFTKREAP